MATGKPRKPCFFFLRNLSRAKVDFERHHASLLGSWAGTSGKLAHSNRCDRRGCDPEATAIELATVLLARECQKLSASKFLKEIVVLVGIAKCAFLSMLKKAKSWQ